MNWPPDSVDDEPDGTDVDGLIQLVERQRDLITAVATGESIPPHLDSEYKRRRRKVRAGLQRLGIEDPFPLAGPVSVVGLLLGAEDDDLHAAAHLRHGDR